MPRSFALAAFAALWLAAPAFAAPTDQERLEKAVRRYAEQVGAPPSGKIRALCACQPGGLLPAGAVGVLLSQAVPTPSGVFVTVSCFVPGFDTDGGSMASDVCDDWKLLAR